jgi:hypothetical protein
MFIGNPRGSRKRHQKIALNPSENGDPPGTLQLMLFFSGGTVWFSGFCSVRGHV